MPLVTPGSTKRSLWPENDCASIKKRKLDALNDCESLWSERYRFSEDKNNVACFRMCQNSGTCGHIQCTFCMLHCSRKQALHRLMHSQYDEAIYILRKVEHIQRSMSVHRRKHILTAAHCEQSISIEPARARTHRVHFNPQITAISVEMVDRSIGVVLPPTLEEMLVIRANRQIPMQNYSELW